MLGYCQVIVGGKLYGRELVGGHRCTRLAKRTECGYVLCTQHASIAKRGGMDQAHVAEVRAM